jgi:hypothetical protein
MTRQPTLKQAEPRLAQPRARQLAPVEAYISDDWFKREQNDLFARVWLFAGMSEDLRSPGDYKCVDAGPSSLIVLRDQDNPRRRGGVARHDLRQRRSRGAAPPSMARGFASATGAA